MGEMIAHYFMDELWERVRTKTFERDMKKKRFGFAVSATSKVILSDLAICFSYVEPQANTDGLGWALEAETRPALVDSWATQSLRSIPKKLPKGLSSPSSLAPMKALGKFDRE